MNEPKQTRNKKSKFKGQNTPIPAHILYLYENALPSFFFFFPFIQYKGEIFYMPGEINLPSALLLGPQPPA